MIEIVPAVLPVSFDDLREHLERIRGAAQQIQIDIVDGIFAPNTTWPYDAQDWKQEIGTWKEKTPFGNDFEFEIDLMVESAEEAAEWWRAAGAKRIIIHIESPDAREALMALRFEKEEAKVQGPPLEGSPRIGIALPCGGSVEMLTEYENLYDYVQVMGIEKVGFQGQPFDRRALDVVRTLRGHYSNLDIQVDGGVSEKTIPDLVRAGANRLVAGSAIWQNEDPRAELQKLRGVIQSSK